MKQAYEINQNNSTWNRIISYWVFAYVFSIPFGIFLAQLFAGAGILLLLVGLFRKKLVIPAKHPAFYALILVILSYLLASILSEDPLHSLRRLFQYFFLPLGGFFALLLTVSNRDSLLKAYQAFLISGIICSLYAFFQFFTGIDYFNHPPGDMHNGLFKPSGFYNLSLTFAGVQMVYFLILLPVAWNIKQKSEIISVKWKYLGWAALFILGLSILITFQRSAWIGAFLAILIFLLMQKNKLARFSLAGMILLVILLVLFVPSINSKVKQSFDFKQANQSERLVMWPVALEIGQENMVTGVGPGLFGRYAHPRIPEELRHMSHAHNDVLQTWATTGILGTVTSMALFVLIIAWAFRERQGSGAKCLGGEFYLGGILAYLGFVLASQFQCFLIDGENALSLSVVLGVSMAARKLLLK